MKAPTLQEFLPAFFYLYFPILIFIVVAPTILTLVGLEFLLSLSLFRFNTITIALASILSTFISMLWIVRHYSLNQIKPLHGAGSIVGLLSLITLLPFSIVVFQNFRPENLLKLGYVVLIVIAHGLIVYSVIRFSKK